MMNPLNSKHSNIPVEAVTFLENTASPCWKGFIRLPDQQIPIDILIFNIDNEYFAVPAHCPHQGYDLSDCPLVNGYTLICPAHHQRTNLKASDYAVQLDNGRFLITLNNSKSDNNDAKTINILQEELDQLRLANQKQQRQILVITKTMDAMLSESEAQKTKLKERIDQQQALSRFVDSIMNTMGDLLFVIDKNGLILRMNAAVERELGFTETELTGTCIDNLLSPVCRKYLADGLPTLPWAIRSILLETIQLNGYYSGEHELIGKNWQENTSIYWLKSSLLHSAQGKFEGAVVTALNIAELKNRESQLRLSNKVFENTCEAIFITDQKGTILEVNDAFCTITGYDRHEALGQNTRLLKSHLHDERFYQNLWQSLLYQGFWKGEIWDRRKNGELCPLLLSINAVSNEQGLLTNYVAIATDISHQKKTEQDLQELAYYDVLTGLPNRSLFKDRLEHEILLAERNNQRLAVFFLDLDHFKNINDTLGHWAGDNLLQIAAKRLQSCVRKSDTVARLSGDEFTIILPELSNIDYATELAQQLVNIMASPIQIKDHTVYVGVSIGIAIFPNDGEDFHTLTRHADTAMYAAKIKGRGAFQYFEADMNKAAQQRLLLENALRLALDREEFQLYYQPKADCITQKIVGAEALIRWLHPEVGMMPPDSFIPIAEETGLIIPLGIWILKTACLQAKIWAKQQAGFRIAINLSPRQLLADDFIEILDSTLAETGINPAWIELEITESLVMHNIKKASHRLQQIRERGIEVAMDDFGTGYSSLSYLKILPIQTLKIDRSFVQAYQDDPTSNEAAFIKTFITLGQVLNITVVAEGVETESQLALLQSYGCHVYQGYLLSRPLAKEEFQLRWLG